MTPERIREMVTAMHAAGESDEAIKAALDLARKQETPAVLTPEKKAKLEAGIAKQKAKVDALNAEPDPMSLGQIAKNVIPTSAALLDRLWNGATFGGWQATMDKVGEGENYRARQDALNSSAPGRFAGDFMGGVGGTATGSAAGAGLLGMLESKVPALATSALGRVAANTGVGAVTGAGSEAAHATSEGEGLEEIGRRAGKGALVGGALGAGFSGVGEGAGVVSRVIRKDPAAGRYLKAKEVGAYKDPEMASLPKGKQGMQEAADATVEKMATREKTLAAQREAEWDMTGADPATLAKPIDTKPILQQLRAGRQKHIDPDTGLPADGADSIVAAYDRAISRTGAQATVGGVLKRRQSLKKSAAFDNPNPSPEQLAARDVYQTFRQAVRGASDELAAADDAFSASAKAADRRAELVGADLTTAGPAQMEAAAARLGRVEDTNRPGLRTQKRLDELHESDPEIAAAMDFLANKKAQEAVRFGLPNTSPDLSKATLFAGIPRFLGQNARAIGAKVVDPAASATQRNFTPVARALPGFIPEIEQAYAEYLERKRRQQQ